MKKPKKKRAAYFNTRPTMGMPENEALRVKNRAASITSQVLCWGCVIALNEMYGIGNARLNSLAAELSNTSEKYQRNISALGRSAADAILRGACKEILPKLPRLPRERLAKTSRERLEWQAQSRAADEMFYMLALCLRRTFNYGPVRIANVLEETVKNWQQFMEWNNGGTDEDYAMERLRFRVQQILRCEVRLEYDPGEIPKFAN